MQQKLIITSIKERYLQAWKTIWPLLQLVGARCFCLPVPRQGSQVCSLTSCVVECPVEAGARVTQVTSLSLSFFGYCLAALQTVCGRGNGSRERPTMTEQCTRNAQSSQSFISVEVKQYSALTTYTSSLFNLPLGCLFLELSQAHLASLTSCAGWCNISKILLRWLVLYFSITS